MRAPVNGGYAAGVNLGLQCLLKASGIDRFWILNPDSIVDPGTPLRFATAPDGEVPFGIMGGRLSYLDMPDVIQLDGGIIDWRTGGTRNLNQGLSTADCPAPDAKCLDFVSGGSMVVTRAFCDHAGLMPEDYFLYYEEVEWALRRGAMPISYCPDAVVYHRAGTSIGSSTPGRVGSDMALYFKHRNRIRFLRKTRGRAPLAAYAFTFAKAAQVALKGHPRAALIMVRASFGFRPTPSVMARLAPDAARLAFAG
jgi:hypothetical protein